jgi:hypothetical protein
MRHVRPVLALLALACALVFASSASAAVAGTSTCKGKSAAAVKAAKKARVFARTHKARKWRKARARARAQARLLARLARKCHPKGRAPRVPAPAAQAGIRPAASAQSTYRWNFDGNGEGNGCARHGLSCPGLEGWDVPQWKEMANGQTKAVDPASYGVPGLDGGSGGRVLRASVNEAQRDSGAYAAYLYKVWAVAAPETSFENEFTGQPYERMTRGQEAGTYRAWYYLPESTRTTLQHNSDDRHGWVNIFQFKHSSPDMNGPGRWDQNPQWWINIRNNEPEHLSFEVSREGDPAWGERNGLDRLPEVPFGRWFELRADVRPGSRIDFYLDGKLFETGRASDGDIGLNPGDSSWVFSPGYYLNTGTAYIDDVTFDRKPADW